MLPRNEGGKIRLSALFSPSLLEGYEANPFFIKHLSEFGHNQKSLITINLIYISLTNNM